MRSANPIQRQRWWQVSLLGVLLVVWFRLLAPIHPGTQDASRLVEAAPVPQTLFAPLILETGSPPPSVPPDGIASWGSPIVLSPDDKQLWVVNPDAGSVTVLDSQSLQKITEIGVGREPWSLAIAPNGQRVYVVDRAAGTVVVIATTTFRVVGSLSVGSEPAAIALSPTGATAYITLSSANEVAVIDTHWQMVRARIPVEAQPFAIAVTDDGDAEDGDEQIYITHLIALPRPGGVEGTDNGREGRVTVIEAETNAVHGLIALAPRTQGFPNLLMGIAISGQRAWVPLLYAAPDLPRTLTTTVFAAVAALDLDQAVEDDVAHLMLNDQEVFGSPTNNPVAAIPSPDGNTLYVVLAGSNLVEVVDVSADTPRLVRFMAVGHNPRGMALSQDGQRGYIMDYLSRSVTVLDLENLEPIAEIAVTSETLTPDVLQGKILFHNATDPRLSRGSWISCASCHPDGGTDGVTWMFPDGPRQTPPLWNAIETRPWHWSAALDEGQDVEDTIQRIQHGQGLAPGSDPALLAMPNAGRSEALDALAAFLLEDIRVPVPPPSGEVAQGRTLFITTGCAVCHGGPTWTSSAMAGAAGTIDPDGNGMVDSVLRNVGTLNPRDIQGATGFDPPSLLNVALTAPYLHDGSMPTLEALLRSSHPDPDGDGNGLNEAEIATLTAFLRAIGIKTPPVERP